MKPKLQPMTLLQEKECFEAKQRLRRAAIEIMTGTEKYPKERKPPPLATLGQLRKTILNGNWK